MEQLWKIQFQNKEEANCPICNNSIMIDVCATLPIIPNKNELIIVCIICSRKYRDLYLDEVIASYDNIGTAFSLSPDELIYICNDNHVKYADILKKAYLIKERLTEIKYHTWYLRKLNLYNTPQLIEICKKENIRQRIAAQYKIDTPENRHILRMIILTSNNLIEFHKYQ